ncbi:MAG: hypothetical protein DRJ09_04405 [Bacteroidetes bacterium]|nr:MAG: hypothetical protein DRJ09_04405 [Bacteroidota bacterium]
MNRESGTGSFYRGGSEAKRGGDFITQFRCSLDLFILVVNEVSFQVDGNLKGGAVVLHGYKP